METIEQINLPQRGFIKLMRTPDVFDLMEAYPLAFTLATMIALRARYRPTVSVNGLKPGEAFLGDYEKCGLTERQYRTAKQKLKKGGYATFRTTNKGTIAKLADSRLFDVWILKSDAQKAEQPTDDRRLTEPVEKGNNIVRSVVAAATNDAELGINYPNHNKVKEFAESQNFDPQYVEQFLYQMERDGWMIKNKLTSKFEPVRDWQKLLDGFCKKLERDRTGEKCPF